MKKPVRLIIDADYMIYYSGRKFEDVNDWGDGILTTVVSKDQAKAWINRQLKEFKEMFDAKEVVIALSCNSEDGFRREICKDYKVNRLERLRPAGHAYLRHFMIQEKGGIVWDKLEADDICGILGTDDSKYDNIIISPDKDMRTLPVRQVNPDKLDQGIYHPTPAQALKFWMKQVLVGDPADGYKGCPGVGEITAEKLFKGVMPNLYIQKALDTYLKKGLTREDFIKTARLSFILRKDYYENEEIKLVFENGIEEFVI